MIILLRSRLKFELLEIDDGGLWDPGKFRKIYTWSTGHVIIEPKFLSLYIQKPITELCSELIQSISHLCILVF